MLLRACPRCGGDLHATEDLYGSFHQCIQCGHIQDLPDERLTVRAKRAVATPTDTFAA